MEFPGWHPAFGLTSQSEELGKISSVLHSNELGDARDMLVFVKQTKRTQEMVGTRCREHFSERRRCVSKCIYGENTAENETRSAHVLRTHVYQLWARDLPVNRGTAFSRGRPLPSRAAACSRTLTLASDAVATHLPVVTEHKHNSASRSLESNSFSSTPRKGQERAFGTF